MHDITFENNTRTHYIAVIDGVAIEFSTAMSKISYGDRNALSEYVDRVKQNLNAGLPLAPLSTQMNGVNMLRLLAGIFREQAIQAWMNFVMKNISLSTQKAFVAYFGFKHNKTVFPSEFGSELFEMSLQHHKAVKEKAKADAEEERRICKRNRTLLNLVSELEKTQSVSFFWVVEKRSVSGNVVTYIINGHDFSFCLSNHSLLNSAKNVAEILSSFEEAFNSGDSSAIKNAIKKIGGKAALQIMNALFHNEAKQFFQSDFLTYVISKRTKPAPSVYMKTYFGGSCNLEKPFYLELLTMLEDTIPILERQLIDSSEEEIVTKKDEWRLFYYERTSFLMCSITFPDTHPLSEEIRQYLTFLYNQLTYSGVEPVPILFESSRAIQKVIENVDRPFMSAIDLSSWDYRSVIVSMSKTVKLSTIRAVLFRMRRFLSYLNPDVVEKAIPLCIIPAQVLNPVQPLSTAVITRIAEHWSELSPHVWIAFQVFAITGARASSVFDLTVDDLVVIGGKMIAHIYYNKAAARKAKSTTPSYVPQDISDVSQELNQYIAETSYLRSLLPTPYIFVYESSTFRQQSLRKPKVLTSGAFCKEIKNLCAKYGIYNEDGSVPNPTAQGIRAEVGRALFAKGASPQDVAGKLHNTASVAKRHYDSIYPADEAAMRRELYSKTVDSAVDSSEAGETYPFAKNDPMYGSCKSSDMCRHGNDCRNCSERIQKRQKEV